MNTYSHTQTCPRHVCRQRITERRHRHRHLPIVIVLISTVPTAMPHPHIPTPPSHSRVSSCLTSLVSLGATLLPSPPPVDTRSRGLVPCVAQRRWVCVRRVCMRVRVPPRPGSCVGVRVVVVLQMVLS